MAIVAMIILATFIWLITGPRTIFSRPAAIYTYMPDSAALAKGAPVRLNGIVVGSVADLKLSGEANPRRIVKIDMSIPKDMLQRIPVDSTTEISAENVLGTKFINIKMGKSRTMVQPGGELPSLDTMEFEDVVKSSYSLLTSLQGIVTRVDTIIGEIENGKGSIGKLLVDTEVYDRLVATEAQMQKIAETIGSGKGTLGRLLYDETLYQRAQQSIERLDSVIQGLQEGQGSAGKFLKDPAVYDQAREAMAGVRKLVDDLNAGNGTAGKLLKDEELYHRLLATLGKIDATVDKAGTTIDKVNSGEGTVGQLLVNPQLYDNLNGTTAELHALIKDIHSNPKKFLRIKLGLF
jgi:phospholipid/cholesterol/gamma-HCH transport system substrate-binding protein